MSDGPGFFDANGVWSRTASYISYPSTCPATRSGPLLLLELGQRPLRHRHDVRRRSGTAIGPHERRARLSRAFGGVAEPSQANSAPVPARTPTPRCDEVFWYSYCLVAGGDAPATSKPEPLWYHRLRRAAATLGVASIPTKRRLATFWHYYLSLRVARWQRTRPRDDLSYSTAGRATTLRTRRRRV